MGTRNANNITSLIINDNFFPFTYTVRPDEFTTKKKKPRKISLIEYHKGSQYVPDRVTIFTNRANPPPNFFIPAHPVLALLIPYGLLLTFSSALFPDNIPSFIPLGELAKYLGNTYPTLMQFLALFAAAAHVSYPFYMIKLTIRYQLLPKESFLWIFNGFFFGIFGIWPLVFYDIFLNHATTYCNIPLSIC